jgi:hypothetical protein
MQQIFLTPLRDRFRKTSRWRLHLPTELKIARTMEAIPDFSWFGQPRMGEYEIGKTV